MSKYRKKPVVIEAVQWSGKNIDEIKAFCVYSIYEKIFMTAGADLPNEHPSTLEWKLSIRTLEGDMVANKGDWVIKGVSGEFYPCKPDIFEKTYEPVE